MHVLGDLFVAAVQVADVRVRLGDDFAVQLEHDAQHSVGRRVRRTHVERHGLSEQFPIAAGFGLDCAGARGGIGRLETSGHAPIVTFRGRFWQLQAAGPEA